MLVLQRKVNESLTIAGGIVVTVCRIRGDAVRIGIDADPSIKILRSECIDDGRPARPSALPNVHTEVERLTRRLAQADDLIASNEYVVERLKAHNLELMAELASAQADVASMRAYIAGQDDALAALRAGRSVSR